MLVLHIMGREKYVRNYSCLTLYTEEILLDANVHKVERPKEGKLKLQ